MEKKTTVAPLPDLFKKVVPNLDLLDPFDAPPLRWGILGAGGIARTFARDVPANSSQKVVAIGSRSFDRAALFAEEMGIPQNGVFGSYEELVNSDQVDAIYIATPHGRHAEDALLAIGAGKPVLVEKAFAMNVDETRAIFDAASSRGLFAMEAMWSRHLPHYRFLDALTKSGALGEVRWVQADHSQKLGHVQRLVDPALGGGAMLDLGVYPMHFAHMILGVPKAIKSATRMTDRGVDCADNVIGEYPGALSTLTTSMDSWSPTGAFMGFEGGAVSLPEQFYRPTNVELTVHELDSANGAILSSESATWDSAVLGGFQYEAADAARNIAAGNTESAIVSWQDTLDVMGMMTEVLDRAGVQYP